MYFQFRGLMSVFVKRFYQNIFGTCLFSKHLKNKQIVRFLSLYYGFDEVIWM